MRFAAPESKLYQQGREIATSTVPGFQGMLVVRGAASSGPTRYPMRCLDMKRDFLLSWAREIQLRLIVLTPEWLVGTVAYGTGIKKKRAATPTAKAA